MSIGDLPEVNVDELVVLKKFEGDNTEDANEFERLTILNGEVVSHDEVANGEIVGPVGENNLTGKNIGRLMSEEKEVE